MWSVKVLIAVSRPMVAQLSSEVFSNWLPNKLTINVDYQIDYQCWLLLVALALQTFRRSVNWEKVVDKKFKRSWERIKSSWTRLLVVVSDGGWKYRIPIMPISGLLSNKRKWSRILGLRPLFPLFKKLLVMLLDLFLLVFEWLSPSRFPLYASRNPLNLSTVSFWATTPKGIPNKKYHY